MSQRKTTTRATTIVSGVSLEWEIDNGWWNIVASAVLPSYCVCAENIVSIFFHREMPTPPKVFVF